MSIASKLGSVDVGGLVIDGIVGLLGLTMVGVVFAAIAAAKGPGKCRSAFDNQTAYRPNVRVEIGSMWARTLDDHWVAALVFQPKNLEDSAYTVVCHFNGQSWAVDSIGGHLGDQRSKLKMISTNNMLPWTWF